jgi:cobalt-zinc-cadmium resistance protein CzcA
MVQRIVDFALREKWLMLSLGIALLVWGIISFHRLPVEAYPDVAPPWVQVITQWPGHAAEEVEQQITVPIEIQMNGIAHMVDLRSQSLFGLSVVTMIFTDHSDDLLNREQVLERLSGVVLPANVQPMLGPDYSPVGQIYWYTLESTNPRYDLMQLKTLQDWVLERQFKSVPGVVDVSSFGGLTRQYQVLINPEQLINYDLTLSQVEQVLAANNTNAGGSFVEHGQQAFNVRAVGLMQNTQDIAAAVLKVQNGTPVRVRDVGEVVQGHAIRLGQIGKTVRNPDGTIVDDNDVVEGIVLLRKGAQTDSTLRGIEEKVADLNRHVLPPGVKIVPYLDRSDLIQYTTDTVLRNLTDGFLLVTILLFFFLGNIRSAVIVASTIPFSLLFAATCLDLSHIPANLLSLGALDFGMVVDGTVVMVENILRLISSREWKQKNIGEIIYWAAHEVQRPVFYAILIIITAYLPIFTLQGVAGKLFHPMAWTVAFALLGGLVFALVISTVLSSLLLRRHIEEWHNPILLFLGARYRVALRWCLRHRKATLASAGALFVAMIYLATRGIIGSEFLPHLDEGAIWARGTLAASTGPSEGERIVHQARLILASFPETTEIVSQVGRPDDGTDATGFFNTEYYVGLKPQKQWPEPYRSDKDKLIAVMDQKLESSIPGVIWNFSQPIEDNVDEAVSGVKGALAVKIYGTDLKTLEAKADEIANVMRRIPGIKDLGVFRVMGQPNINLIVNREQAGRYGINVSDIQDAVETAVGGKTVSQVLIGDRRFDLVVRYEKPYRQTVQDIADIRIVSPSGARISLGQVCDIKVQEGASMIYREGNERYIAVKYSVRGRDLGSTVRQAMQEVNQRVKLPSGYRIDWAGEYANEVAANKRLEVIIPLTLLIIALWVYAAFDSFKWVWVILLDVALAPLGGLIALLMTGTYFSVSSGVGLLALFGVSTQIGLVMLEYINQLRARGLALEDAIVEACQLRLRPIMMTMLVATLGLLPAALSHAIGSDSQRPFAIVIVGGLSLSLAISIFFLPTLYACVAKPTDVVHDVF